MLRRAEPCRRTAAEVARALARSLVVSASALLLLAVPALGEETGPPVAVSGVNGTVSGAYRGVARFSDNFFDPSDSGWRNAGGVSGEAFVPLGRRFGFGAWVGGLWGEGERGRPSPLVIRTTPDLTFVLAGGGFFWRDPDSGLVGLFYDFSREEQRGTDYASPFGLASGVSPLLHRIQTTTIHDVTLERRWYLRDVDLGFDGSCKVTVASLRLLRTISNSSDSTDFGLEMGGTASAYPGTADRVRVGLDFRGGQVAVGEGAGYVQGEAFVDWQPHFFGNRSVRLGGSLGGGAAFGGPGTRGNVTLGATVSIDWPGTEGLKRLFREHRI